MNIFALKLIAKGMQDCQNGLPTQSDSSPYVYGYGLQYELEQRQGAK